jgi:acetolactate decarboxylase
MHRTKKADDVSDGRAMNSLPRACIFGVLNLVLISPIMTVHAGTPLAPQPPNRSGMLNHVGEQRQIVETGRASGTISLNELAGLKNLYAIGPVEGLDGEITILNSRPYVSKVRADATYSVDRTLDHRAIFLVWAQVINWRSVCIPASVTNYSQLEAFIKDSAQRLGIPADSPFPFRMAGAPKEIVWHINVDRTDGQPITQDLFRKSKQYYELRGERVDIVGAYSDKHQGVFTGPRLRIHLHFVSQESAATGHVDEINPARLILRLPCR